METTLENSVETLDTQVTIVSGLAGPFLPRDFIQKIYAICPENWIGVSQEDIAILGVGPRADDYWETWDEVLAHATYIDDQGRWTLLQGQDLYLIHETFDS